MAKSEFRQQIEAAIQQRHSKTHPWSDAWVGGRLNKALLGEWVKQHYHYVSLFPQWLATVYGNCPYDDVRHFITENIMEEEGFVGDDQFPAVKHTDLLLDFGEPCGMSRREVIDAQRNGELLPETLGLQSWCFRQPHHPAADREIRLPRGGDRLLPPSHRRRCRAWRARLRDPRALCHDGRDPDELRPAGTRGDADAPALSRRALQQVPRRPRQRGFASASRRMITYKTFSLAEANLILDAAQKKA